MIADKLLTVAQNDQAIAEAAEAIRQAIIAKGVTVDEDTPLSDYPDMIEAIEQCGGAVEGHIVRFIDYDGVIIKTQTVLDGGDATPPTQYEIYKASAEAAGKIPLSGEDWEAAGSVIREFHIFDTWNNSYTNITDDKEIGAIYDTVDQAMYLFVCAGIATFPSSISLKLNKVSGTMLIDWGDGSSTTVIENGNISQAHAFNGGYYTIKVQCDGPFNLTNGNLCGSGANNGCLEKVYLGSRITLMGDSVFYAARNLLRISLPSTLTTLGDSDFRTRNPLKAINIPAGITEIPAYCFYESMSMSQVVLPDGITSIGSYAFYNCLTIEDCRLPDSVVTIGDYAFYAAYKMKLPKLPASLTTLGVGCFWALTLAKFEEIPPGVTSLPQDCFRSCNYLRKLHIHGGVKSIGAGCFYTGIFLEDLTLGEGVETIGGGWIENASKIVKLVMPSTIKSIAGRGFINWNCLKVLIMLPTTPPTLGAIPFANNAATPLIFVPDSSINAYKAATNWNLLAANIVPMSFLPLVPYI